MLVPEAGILKHSASVKTAKFYGRAVVELIRI